MIGVEFWWRSVVRLAAVLASSAIATMAMAQTPLPPIDPATVTQLAFRPAANDTLLLAATDAQGRLQVRIVRLIANNKPVLTRTLPGSFTGAAWLDDSHILTADANGKLESWPLVGDGPALLTTLTEPVAGIGVSPITRTLVVRLAQTIRLFAMDGRPNGPTVTLGRPAKPTDVCPPDDLEVAPSFSPDERLAGFAGLCGDLRVIGRDGTRLIHADLSRGTVRRLAFSSDGKLLVVAYSGQAGADAWPVAPGRLGTPKPFPAIESENDADLASFPNRPGFVLLTGDRVRFVAPDGSALYPDAALAQPRRVGISYDGSRIAVAAAEGLVLFDGNGQRIVARPFAEFGDPLAAMAAARGTAIAALHHDGRMRLWRVDGTEMRTPVEGWGKDASASDVTAQKVRLLTSPNGRLTGVLGPVGTFEIFDESWKSVGRPMRFPPDANGAALRSTLLLDDRILRPLPDGTGFLAMGFDGRFLGKVAYGEQQKMMSDTAAATASLIAVYSAGGRLALWSGDGRLLRQRRIDILNLNRPRLEMSADGKVVVLHDEPANLPPHLLVWRTDQETPEFRDGAYGALLPDGSLLRINRGRLAIDAPDGTARQLPVVEADRVAAVTPDGKLALVTKSGVTRTVKLAP